MSPLTASSADLSCERASATTPASALPSSHCAAATAASIRASSPTSERSSSNAADAAADGSASEVMDLLNHYSVVDAAAAFRHS
ncbi:hypothetical protein BH09ACT8_BH09ACT8_37550 [soil metagenome]